MAILQDHVPADQLEAAAAPLPRMRPARGHWITVDGAYAAQIAERRRLLRTRRADVCAAEPGTGPILRDLRRDLLSALAVHPRFAVSGSAVICPDGRPAEVGEADVLGDLSSVLAEDLCLLERRGDEHVLVAAALCFPAGWTLAEKFGRPLTRIHAPVPPYDDSVAPRVQRFMDAVRPGAPIWRANLHGYAEPDLFAPRREADAKRKVPRAAGWFRSERQTLLRLTGSGAVLFAIHTCVVAAGAPGLPAR